MRKDHLTPEQAEQEYTERDRRETQLDEMPEPRNAQEAIEQMKQIGLYCGTCGHGNGCEHGVPASRW